MSGLSKSGWCSEWGIFFQVKCVFIFSKNIFMTSSLISESLSSYVRSIWVESDDSMKRLSTRSSIDSWRKKVQSRLSKVRLLCSPCKRRSPRREESLVSRDPCGLWIWELVWSEHINTPLLEEAGVTLWLSPPLCCPRWGGERRHFYRRERLGWD